MSVGCYSAIKTAVSFAMFLVSIIPTFFLAGFLARQMPAASAPVALAFVGLLWLIAMLLGSNIITEKLVQRWSH